MPHQTHEQKVKAFLSKLEAQLMKGEGSSGEVALADLNDVVDLTYDLVQLRWPDAHIEGGDWAVKVRMWDSTKYRAIAEWAYVPVKSREENKLLERLRISKGRSACETVLSCVKEELRILNVDEDLLIAQEVQEVCAREVALVWYNKRELYSFHENKEAADEFVKLNSAPGGMFEKLGVVGVASKYTKTLKPYVECRQPNIDLEAFKKAFDAEIDMLLRVHGNKLLSANNNETGSYALFAKYGH
jgi:hypothetical protein